MGKSLANVALRDRTRREVTHRGEHIPPLPENVTRLLKLLEKEDTEPAQLEDLVKKDQVLVGRLLRLARSPLYGVGRPMNSIKDATMVVGFRGLRSLIMASSTAQHLKRDSSVYGFEQHGLWLHSVAVGAGGRFLARRVGLTPNQQEEQFIVGLLHDIGKLVLVHYLGDARPREPGEALTDWERAVCGVDHVEAGGVVAQKWQLSESISRQVMAHHGAAAADEPATRLLRVANARAHERRIGFLDSAAPDREVDPVDLTVLGLADRWEEVRDELDAVVDQAVADMAAI